MTKSALPMRRGLGPESSEYARRLLQEIAELASAEGLDPEGRRRALEMLEEVAASRKEQLERQLSAEAQRERRAATDRSTLT